MAETGRLYISKDGLKKLEEELEYLRTVRRKEVAERIVQAKEYGDITDNSEYEDAKNEQAFVEGRILELEKILRIATVLEERDLPSETVTIGSRVKLENITAGEEEEYVIVGNVEEVDPRKCYISAQSPLGHAVLGKRALEEFFIDALVGRISYRIKEIVR